MITAAAAAFAVTVSTISWWHWWTYQYGSFDLAFYVQGLWLALRGQWHVSLLDVPLLGNHAEPIVFLLAPIFALIPHPMTLVAVQTMALATMPFTAWRIARRLGLDEFTATALAVVTVLAPATGFVGIHEFHPEAFAAPLILLLIEARIARQLRAFWLWFLLSLACKENVALILVTWCAVYAFLDRQRGASWQWGWNLAPFLLAASWVVGYALWLSPLLNGGRVDYLQLYSHLGDSPGGVLTGFFTAPDRALRAIWNSTTSGNLVWGLLASFVALPLFRPRWLLIASPVLFQHLLSNRPSEWTIHYHYTAPLLPFLWIATAEVMTRIRYPRTLACAALLACAVLQVRGGPARFVDAILARMEITLWSRQWKAALIDSVAENPRATVTAGMPYLSHLATRRELHSLHFVIKGLKTLSLQRYRADYDPEIVLIDFADDPTFNRAAAFYHPEAASVAGHPLLSSDQLLHQFLSRHSWATESMNSMTVFRRGQPPEPTEFVPTMNFLLEPHTHLRRIRLGPPGKTEPLSVHFDLEFTAPRQRMPWLIIRLTQNDSAYVVELGMCAPQMLGGIIQESRQIQLPPMLPAGRYQVSAIFFDQIASVWRPDVPSRSTHAFPLGEVVIQASSL